jgi:hypothetical protein
MKKIRAMNIPFGDALAWISRRVPPVPPPSAPPSAPPSTPPSAPPPAGNPHGGPAPKASGATVDLPSLRTK